MNNISTEHVTKIFKQVVNATVDVKIIVAFIAFTGLSTLILNREAFTCHTPTLSDAWMPQQVLKTEGYAIRVMDTPNILDAPQAPQSLMANTSKPVLKPTLEVGGIRETDEALTFAMSEFDEDMTYMIDFGNGTTKSLEDESIAHIYEQSGTYKVTVKGIHQGEIKVISTKFLMVADAIETPLFVEEIEI